MKHSFPVQWVHNWLFETTGIIKIDKNDKTKVIYEPGSKKILGYHDYFEILIFF